MEAIGKDPSLPNIQIDEKKQATRNADRVKVPAQQLIDQELNGLDLSNEQREKLVICRQALELLRDDTAHEVLYVFSARKSTQRSSTVNINFSFRGKAEVEQVMPTIGNITN